MKTDRELLELAARAAGVDLGDTTFDGWGDVIQSNWNPLADDGLALRLAVKLGFSIDLQYGEEERMTLVSTWNGLMFSEYHGSSNPNAATRRAIVRAAAEIGETL